MSATNGNGKPFAGLAPEIGIGASLPPGIARRAQAVLDDLERLGTEHLRLIISPEAWKSSEGRRWYEWLLRAAAERTHLLPVLAGGPAEFAEQVVAALAPHLDTFEVGGVPPEETTRRVQFMSQYGITPVVGVAAGNLESEIPALAELGALDLAGAVALRGFPETAGRWDGWANRLELAGEALRHAGVDLPLWTVTGRSTWIYRDHEQLEAFADAVTAPATRVYWHSARDETDAAANPRCGLLGLADEHGHSKLLLRLLETGGLDQVRTTIQATRSPKPVNASEPVALVTGGAGFVGANVADHLLSTGRRVVILDNLARPGTEQNLMWLQERHPDRLEFRLGDIRDGATVREAVERADQVYHFAAQVAVTTSLEGPVDDFEVNSRGTLNLLEAIRSRSIRPRCCSPRPTRFMADSVMFHFEPPRAITSPKKRSFGIRVSAKRGRSNSAVLTAAPRGALISTCSITPVPSGSRRPSFA